MSEPLSAERLAEIRARAEAATEGPWEAKSCGDTCCQWIERHDGEMLPRTDTYFDARFIAHARTDVPDLLAEIDRLRAWQALSRLQALAAESGPSRWFSAADDERHGTDPAWDGIES